MSAPRVDSPLMSCEVPGNVRRRESEQRGLPLGGSKMANAGITRTDLRRDSAHGRDERDVASWPRLSVSTSARPPNDRETLSSSIRELRVPPREPTIPGAEGYQGAVTPQSRVYTGLGLVAMGGLLMLASAGFSWAVNLVRGA